MTIPFQQPFARQYDLLYSEKNYTEECDLLERVFSKYANEVRTVLDAGCGTGNHATELAARGYAVTGVDRSDSVLEIARAKAAARQLDVSYVAVDLRAFRSEAQFDAAICMFAALSYQLTNADLQASLRNIRQSLRSGGLFICDVWNGSAVLANGVHPRIRVASRDGQTAVRFAAPRHSSREQTVEVTQHLMVTGSTSPCEMVVEAQTIRYLVPQELTFHLETAGFEVLAMFPFPRLEGVLSEQDWDIGVVARASR